MTNFLPVLYTTIDFLYILFFVTFLVIIYIEVKELKKKIQKLNEENASLRRSLNENEQRWLMWRDVAQRGEE